MAISVDGAASILLTSSMNSRSASSHGRAVVSVILIQFLLIVWLSVWAVEDYLNNVYVRAYVDGVLQTDAWLFGIIGLVGVAGSVMGLVVRRSRNPSNSLEIVGAESKISTPSPAGVSLKASAAVSQKPSVELHPAVAALKAELSEARMSLGLASVAISPQASSPASKFEDQTRTRQASSLSQAPTPVTNPRPAQQMGQAQPPMIRQSVPSTVIRPLQPSNQTRSPQPPGSGAPQPSGMPTLRVETGNPTVSVQPRPEPGATLRDVSTVITGIVPVQQQKRKDSEPQNGQNNSQQ